MTAVAIGVGVTSCLGGLTLAYHLATPPGPTIALLSVAWFVVLAGADRLRARSTRRVTDPEVRLA
jgi:ABC-type Mn2+/Zn2+ transport system permease subunit